LPKSATEHTVDRILDAMRAEMSSRTRERVFVTHYGAIDIHPKHLVIWIVVDSDREKSRLANDSDLMQRLRGFLTDFHYPLQGRDQAHVGFESVETVNRESGGDFWRHWK
jgi:hypothetical protein